MSYGLPILFIKDIRIKKDEEISSVLIIDVIPKLRLIQLLIKLSVTSSNVPISNSAVALKVWGFIENLLVLQLFVKIVPEG